MASYLISFTISAGSRNYNDVYQSLEEAVNKVASDTAWDETTSFFALDSDRSTSDVADSIYFGSELLEGHDVLLVINTSKGEYRQRGAKYPNTLKARLGLTEV